MRVVFLFEVEKRRFFPSQLNRPFFFISRTRRLKFQNLDLIEDLYVPSGAPTFQLGYIPLQSSENIFRRARFDFCLFWEFVLVVIKFPL